MMQKGKKIKSFIVWILIMVLCLGSYVVPVSAEDSVIVKNNIYFVKSSPKEINIGKVRSLVEKHILEEGVAIENTFCDKVYTLSKNIEDYVDSEEIVEEILNSGQLLSFEGVNRITLILEKVAEKGQKEFPYVLSDGREITVNFITYEELGIKVDSEETLEQEESDLSQNPVPEAKEPVTGELKESVQEKEEGNVESELKATMGKVRVGGLISSLKTDMSVVDKDVGQLFKMYYGVSAEAVGTIEIVDASGSVIKTLYNTFTHKQGYYALSWDLRKEDKSFVDAGTYKAVLEFQTGQRKDTGEITFTVKGMSVSSVKADKKEINVGKGETVSFYYQINRAEKGSVEIYNSKGEKVKSIYNKFPHALGYYKATWDGKDQRGKTVTAGDYIIRIEFAGVRKELPVKVIEDEKISIISSAKLEKNEVDLKKGEVVKFYYGLNQTAQGDVSVRNADGEVVRKIYNQTLHSAGYYVAQWDGKNSKGKLVSSGEYQIVLNFAGDEKVLTVYAKNESISGHPFELTSVKIDKSSAVVGEIIKLNYNLTGDSYGTIVVKNEKGDVAKSLYKDTFHKKGYYALTWDLKDHNDKFVEAGQYSIEMTFTFGTYVKSQEIKVEVKSHTIISSYKLEKNEVDTGNGEIVKFYYGLNQTAQGDVSVCNAAGEIVRKIYDQTPHSGGYYVAQWDGKDSKGKLVSSGEYQIVLNFSGDKKVLTVYVKNEPTSGHPFELTSVKVDKSSAVIGETIKLNYNLTGDSHGTIVIENDQGKEIKSLYQNALHKKGYYALIWDLKDNSDKFVEPGEYSIKMEFVSGTYKKSQSIQIEVKKQTVISSYKLENPKVDFNKENVRVSYGVLGAVAGDIKVYDEHGEEVKVLCDNVMHQPGYYAVQWDGTDKEGMYVASGEYQIVLRFLGEEYTLKVQVEEKESVLKINSIKASSEAVNIEKSNSVDIFYGITGNSKGTIAIYNEKNEEIETFYKNIYHTSGYYKIVWDLKDKNGKKVPEGMYKIKFNFSDNQKSVKEELVLELVGNFALIGAKFEKERINLTVDNQMKLYYHLTESGKGTIQLYNQAGNVIQSFYNEFEHAAGYYALTWNLKGADGQTVPVGNYEVRMKFERADGKCIEKTLRFEIVDELEVNYIRVSPDPAGLGEQIKLSYHPTKDGYGTIRVYDSKGKELRKWYDNTLHTTGYYAITWDQKDSTGRQIEEGTYTFKLEFHNDETTVEHEISVQIKKQLAKKIWIDAGHGGNDVGAAKGGRYERDDNLRLALELQKVLNQQGQKVYMSRIDSDPQYSTTGLVSLRNRVQKANSEEVDVFVSLHRDSASASATGYTIFTHNSSNSANYNPNAYANKNSGCVALSNSINSELGKVGSFKSRGVKYGSAGGTDDLLVNRVSNMPSCLVEMGFISNSNDNYKFDIYLKQHAKALAKGIMNYLGVPFDEAKYTY